MYSIHRFFFFTFVCNVHGRFFTLHISFCLLSETDKIMLAQGNSDAR